MGYCTRATVYVVTIFFNLSTSFIDAESEITVEEHRW